jgi:curli biogenesis system outer membrane secretion channel CsgG
MPYAIAETNLEHDFNTTKADNIGPERKAMMTSIRKRRLDMRTVRATLAVIAALSPGCANMPNMPVIPGINEPPPPAVAEVAPPPPPPFEGIKKSLAVIRLENKVKTPLPDPTWQIGEGLTEMLTTELFKTGRFVMVERAALADIVKEQELGQTGLIQKETAAKVGEVLGAQLLVAGALTEFEGNAGGGGTGIGIGALALQLRGSTAHVAVDIRLVDSSTGQILKSYNASAKAEERSFSLVARNKQGTTFGSDAYYKTPLGQATREAIAKAVAFIVGEMETVPWTGRVVTTKGREVFVNAGSNVNLRPGATFKVMSKGDDLRDPATGLSLGSRNTHVGTVTINHIEEKFSVGTFDGTGLVKRGDLLVPR